MRPVQKAGEQRKWIGGRLDAAVARQFAEVAAAHRRTVSAELELALEAHVAAAQREPEGARPA
jgi:hypothetical protein